MGLKTKKQIVVGVTGLPGSGKSTFTSIAKSLGYPVIVMGDFIRLEAKKRGIKPTAENLSKLMFKVRKEKGENILAKLTVKAVKKMDNPIVFIDGVRTLKEVEFFKRNLPDFRLIAIYAPEKIRFKRIFKRRKLRVDDVDSWERFKKRDQNELKIGVGEVISKANLTIKNSGSLKRFEAKVKKFLEELNHEISFKRSS